LEFVIFQELNVVDHPMEDFCLTSDDGRIFVVADGVTRDTYERDDHPHGSGSAYAAELFCRRVLVELTTSLSHHDDDFAHAFDAANRDISDLNRLNADRIPTDYLEDDLYGAVGLAAVVADDDSGQSVRYGYVGDCRIAVARPDSSIVIDNPYSLERLYAYLAKWRGGTPEERRRFIRANLRNNSRAIDPAWRTASYGVFTGEEDVRAYYRFGRIALEDARGLLIFSDGITPLVEDEEFIAAVYSFLDGGTADTFRERFQEVCQRAARADPRTFGDDKTLILIRLANQNSLP
jgi:serine/threonine protein phosphatase PrpC